MARILLIIAGIICLIIYSVYLLIFVGPIFLKLFGTLQKKLTMDKLNEQISWCANESPYARCGLSLLDHLYNAQINNNIAPPYQIDISEKDAIQEILQAYKKDLLQKHLNNHFTYERMSHEDFFMLTLQKYLKEHICDWELNGNRMYETKQYQGYGSWGVPHFDAIYAFTDFATAYHKIYHITQVYCLPIHKANYRKLLKKDVYQKLLNNGSLGENDIKATQDRLLTKEMEVSSL